MTIKSFTFNPIEVNTYVLHDETGEGVIIDAACFNDTEFMQLKNYIEVNGIKLIHSLNTHLHFDHCFGAQQIKDHYGLGISANKADESLIARMKEQLQMFGFPPTQSELSIETYIEEGQTIRFGNSSLKTLHVPGHSLGSIVYYDEIGKHLFTGDVLFKESVGRSDLPGGDHFTLIEGIEEKLLSLPPETVVYPGHGPTTTVENEIKYNPYLQ